MSTNGFFSFGEAAVYNTPQLFSPSSPPAHIVAPFWANNDISNRVGNITYEVHTTETSPSYITKVSFFISQQRQVKFRGNWMLVAHWNSVPQFGGSLAAVSSNCPSILVHYLTAFTYSLYRPIPIKVFLSPMGSSLMLCSPTSVVNWVGQEVRQLALVLQEILPESSSQWNKC